MLRSLLERPPVANIRRNHGLEHATIHLLSRRFPQRTFIGRSDVHGFYLYGHVSTNELTTVISEALDRLRKGQRSLAIHPNCGTNLVTSALMAAGASYAALFGGDDGGGKPRFERFPLAVSAVILALILSQPLGRAAQERLTTDADPGDLQILAVNRVEGAGMPLHRVLTRS